VRSFALPHPHPVQRLEIRGPQGRRRVHTQEASREAFTRVLDALADEESDAGEGWSIWWGTAAFHIGQEVVAWVWPEDDSGGARSYELLVSGFEAAGFAVSRSRLATRPEPELMGPLACRDRGARAGRQVFPELDYRLQEGATHPHYQPTSPFSRQTCPRCSRRVLPRVALWGEPTRRWRLRLALGEAVAVGCVPGAPGNAICPNCWATFQLPT